SFHALFVLNGVAFLISALLVVTVLLPTPAAPTRGQGIMHNATYGIDIYLRTPRLRGLLALSAAVAAAGAMVIVNTVVYTRSNLGGSESDVAVAFAAAGAGSMIAAVLLPRMLDRLPQRPAMLMGGALMFVGLALGLVGPDFLGLLALWFLIGVGGSLVQTPAGRLLRRSCHEEDRSAVFSAHFALSHACWLIAYPLSGWLGSVAGLAVTFTVMAAIVLASTLAAAVLWPRGDPYDLEHAHEPMEHDHLHVHDAHHQHVHEGWEGPEPHSHPHPHARIRHRHAFVIDFHHRQWP
ncbi:MAG: MFS transporter, partial [Alphaproteobacteria bacterium]